MGKTSQNDLNKSKLTLAVIHLLEAVGASGRQKVYSLLDNPTESRGDLNEMLLRHGCLDYAHERARSYIVKATDALNSLPPGEAREALVETAHFMANRAA